MGGRHCLLGLFIFITMSARLPQVKFHENIARFSTSWRLRRNAGKGGVGLASFIAADLERGRRGGGGAVALIIQCNGLVRWYTEGQSECAARGGSC